MLRQSNLFKISTQMREREELMKTPKEIINLLKEACEDVLKDPVILKGKKLEYSKKNGSAWDSKIFSEFQEVPKNSVKVCITQTGPNVYYILVSMNMNWRIAADNIVKKIKELCEGNPLVSYKTFEEKFIGFTITF